jgi:hypothetical protein
MAEGYTVARGIVIESVANPKWAKNGQQVYVEMTDERGQTRTFAWSIETAQELVYCLMGAVVGSRNARNQHHSTVGLSR